ncbi:MAG: DNA-formamidopyrimidine glycosylase family protein, partial [Bacillota bacterium]
MPELPEVETVRRSLEELVGRRVVRAEVRSPALVRYPALAEFLTRISGRTFTAL